MTTGCKVWLWIVLISNSITVICVLLGIGIGYYPAYGAYIFNYYLTLIAGTLNIIGAEFLLFGHRKSGFYFLLIVAIGNFFINVLKGINIVIAIIPAIVSPLITYLLIKKNSEIIK